jgi:hypothetical protein
LRFHFRNLKYPQFPFFSAPSFPAFPCMSGLSRVLLPLLFLPLTAARAGQVNWGNAFNSVNLTSTDTRMDTRMVFELGVFASGFVPTAGNTAQWATNWRRAQLAFYNVELSYFNGSHPVLSNAAPFTAGARGYIWGHNGRCTGGEWVLMSAPSWTWPGQSPLELPVNWTVSTASQFIAGQGTGTGFQMKSALIDGPLPVTPWEEWRARHFTAGQLNDPAISGPEADPDLDGTVNLAEYALGGHPLMAGSFAGLVSAGLTLSGGRPRLTMTVIKRCDRALVWSAQASVDLVHWPAGSTLLTDTPEVLTAVENLTASGDGRVFLRPVFQLP